MNKKYEAPQLDIQHFNVADRLTMDVESNRSLPIDPEYGWEKW